MKNVKKICLIELGGTISSVADNQQSEFYKSPEKAVLHLVSGFNLQHIEIIHRVLFHKISHNITPEDLLSFANTIQFLLDDEEISGVVVTVGTNAIEDISYFTGLVVKTEKPIVFTGAHFPQESLQFDGKLNLYNALNVAGSEHAKKLGVLLTFDGIVVSARAACKSKLGFIDNFLYIDNSGYIGEVIAGEFKHCSTFQYRHTFASEFDLKTIKRLGKIFVLYAHIGMDELLLKSILKAGVVGIVSAGFGKGYQCQDITDALHCAALAGAVVVRCPRVGISYGGIDKNYDEKYSFVVSRGLSPHKSSLLLSVACLFTKERKELLRIFEEY